jgi:hypothetical protein
MMFPFMVLLGAHFVGDFILQTHWQASNKSKNPVALRRHVLVWTLVIAVTSVAMFGSVGIPFAVVNGVLHMVTDFFSSRQTARLWAKQDWHNFFIVVGCDQLIHHVTLFLTLLLFFGSAA